MTDNTTFLALPEDIHIRILTELDAYSVVRCAMTCKELYEIVRGSITLEYRIQLYLDGLVDVGASAAGTQNILGGLLSYRQAWFAQEWPGYIEKIVRSSQYRSHISFKFGGGALFMTDGRHLEIMTLPTSSTDDGCVIQHKLSTGGVSEFCIDSAQDVIAILENVDTVQMEDLGNLEGYFRDICIHIRTISTNLDHPLASKGKLWFVDECYDLREITISNPKLEIWDDILMLWTCDYIPRLLIWDWKTGTRLEDFTFNVAQSSLKPRYRHGFGLLGSSDFAFLTRPTGCGSIEIYRLGKYSNDGPTTLLAKLNFPPLSRNSALKSLDLDVDSTPVRQTPHGSFIVNNEEGIYVFGVCYEFQTKGTRVQYFSMTMYVHQRAFMKYCTYDRDVEDLSLDVPWDRWGPANVAVDSSAVMGPRSTHGQRVIFSTSDGQLEIKDFTLSAVLAADAVQPIVSLGEHKPSGVLVKSNTISVAQAPIFANDVEGRLPYVLYPSPLRNKDQPFQTTMMCEKGVVSVMRYKRERDDEDNADNEEDNDNSQEGYLVQIYSVC